MRSQQKEPKLSQKDNCVQSTHQVGRSSSKGIFSVPPVERVASPESNYLESKIVS